MLGAEKEIQFTKYKMHSIIYGTIHQGSKNCKYYFGISNLYQILSKINPAMPNKKFSKHFRRLIFKYSHNSYIIIPKLVYCKKRRFNFQERVDIKSN